MKTFIATTALLFAAITTAHATPTEVIGSYAVQYTPSVGKGPSISQVFTNPFQEYLNVGVPTATMTFLAVTPAPKCGYFCGLGNTAKGSISVSFSFNDPTTNSVSDTGTYTADYWTDQDSVIWNQPDPMVQDFQDGAILDINLVNAQDWTIYPKISFDLVRGATPTPEAPSIAILFGGLLALGSALGLLRKRRLGGASRRSAA